METHLERPRSLSSYEKSMSGETNSEDPGGSSPCTSRIPQPPKSILKNRRSSSGDRLGGRLGSADDYSPGDNSFLDEHDDSPGCPGAGTARRGVRRVRTLPAGTPRPRVISERSHGSADTPRARNGNPSPLARSDSRSRIPKLSVSWWETNSVAGEAPIIPSEMSSDVENEDDNSSVCSHGSRGSSVISQNWTGKSTRYVPHCAKRHMHKNDSPDDYLTPTQRKNRLIADLRKELRNAHKLVSDKDRHIGQLRDRLNELETVLDQGGYLAENHRLLAKIGLMKEQYRKETEALSSRYEGRIRKLRKSQAQETDLTSEGFQDSLDRGLIPPPPVPSGPSASGADFSDFSGFSAFHIPADPATEDGKPGRSDASTETEPDQSLLYAEQQWNAAITEVDRLVVENDALAARVSHLEASDARVHELESGMTHHNVITHHRSSHSSGLDIDPARESELLAQLEAYKAECVAWRTRASECELDAKSTAEQMSRSTSEFTERLVDLEAIREEYERLQALSAQGECNLPNCVEARERLRELEEVMTEFQQSRRGSMMPPRSPLSTAREGLSLDLSASIDQPGSNASNRPSNRASPSPRSPGGGKLRYASEVTAGIQQLNMEMELQAKLMEAEKDQLNEKIQELENSLAVKHEELDTCIVEINDLRKDIHNRKTAIEVAEITMERMREDNTRLRGQIGELEAKVKAFESAGVMIAQGDSGVSATAPTLKKRSRYNVVEMVSRTLQTDLSGYDIEHAVGELGSIKAAYGELEQRYTVETEDYQSRLSQIAESLTVKSSLSDTLNRQLQELTESYEEARSRWAEERGIFTDKIAELGPIAQRVPFLEREVNEGQAEISRILSSHRQEKEELETALEQSLSGAVNTQRDSEEYWKEKMRNLETDLATTKRKLEKAEKELTNTRLKLNLEKSQLESQLGERSSEINTLHNEIYREKHHVKLQTMDLGIDKSLMAMPDIVDMETWINDGDLYCEKSENIKMLQGELAASRRQIEVLNGKLADFVAVANSEKDEKVKNLMKIVDDHQKELENLKLERITDISEKSSLEQKVENLVKERDMLRRKGKENLERLEQEFQLVQKELQSVVNRYEVDKQKLLHKLKSANDHIDMLKWKQGVMKQELRLTQGSLDAGGKPGQASLEMDKLEALLESAEATFASEFQRDSSEGDLSLDEARILADAAAYSVAVDAQTAVAELDDPLHDESQDPGSIPPNPVMSDSGISLKNPESPLKSMSPKHEAILEDENVAQTRGARICVLADEVIEENSTLRNDLEGLREKVDNLLKESRGKPKHEEKSRKKDEETIGKADKSVSDSEIIEVAKQENLVSGQKGTIPSEPVKTSAPELVIEQDDQKSTVSSTHSAAFDERLEEIKEDLRIVLQDHGRMTAAASNVAKTAHASISADGKFEKLEKWLRCDIQQEKLELETVCQWYEKDKFKLADALKNSRREILSLNDECDSLRDLLRDMQGQLQTLQELYSEVCREIHLYKLEDSAKAASELKESTEISKSESDVHKKAAEDEKWRNQVGKIFKEKVLLEKKFRAVRYEKTEADQNLVMLRGELEVVKAAYETERDKLLTRILELSGEVWTEEASTNYVRELQQNLEIKKQELSDFSARYDRDVRKLQEDLYFEKAKKIPTAIEAKLRSAVGDSMTDCSTPKIADEPSPTMTDRQLAHTHTETHKQELLELKDALIEERGKFESMAKDLHSRLRTTCAILAEKEKIGKIMEDEIESLQQAMAVQAATSKEDTERLRQEVEKLTKEKRDEILSTTVVSEESPISLQELEKSWKNELRQTQRRYEADIRSMKRDLSTQHDRFEDSRREAAKKLRSCTNILTEKENCIKILERELRSAEDGLQSQISACAQHVSQLTQLTSFNAKLKALLCDNHIPIPALSSLSFSESDGESNPRPRVIKRAHVRFAEEPSLASVCESISPTPASPEPAFETADEDISSSVRAELAEFRHSYENLKAFTASGSLESADKSDSEAEDANIAVSKGADSAEAPAESSALVAQDAGAKSGSAVPLAESKDRADSPAMFSAPKYPGSPVMVSPSHSPAASSQPSPSSYPSPEIKDQAQMSSDDPKLYSESSEVVIHQAAPEEDATRDQDSSEAEDTTTGAASSSISLYSEDISLSIGDPVPALSSFTDDDAEDIDRSSITSSNAVTADDESMASLHPHRAMSSADDDSYLARNEVPADHLANTLANNSVTSANADSEPPSRLQLGGSGQSLNLLSSGDESVYKDAQEVQAVSAPSPPISNSGPNSTNAQNLPEASGLNFAKVHSIKAEEKAIRLTKELHMINAELEVTRDKFWEEKRKWIAENAQLKEQLQNVKTEISTHATEQESSKAQMEERIKGLTGELERLRSDMDAREAQHQQMYMVMFQKGQEVARAESEDRDASSPEYHTAHPPDEWNVKAMEMHVSQVLSEVDLSDPETSDRISVDHPNPDHHGSTSGHGPGAKQPPGKHDGQGNLGKSEKSDPGHLDVNSSKQPTERAQTHAIRSTKGGHFRAQNPGEKLSKEEIMLRFLRDAMYYFMVNRDPKDHLHAIMNILKFSEQQRSDVLKTKGY